MPTSITNITLGLDRLLEACQDHPGFDKLFSISVTFVRTLGSDMKALLDDNETVFLTTTGAEVDDDGKKWPGIMCISDSHVTIVGRAGTFRQKTMTARYVLDQITFLDDTTKLSSGRRCLRFRAEGQMPCFELPSELMPPSAISWLSGALTGGIRLTEDSPSAALPQEDSPNP